MEITMSRTPRGNGFRQRSDRRKGLTAEEVADLTGTESSLTGFRRRSEGYRPYESLFSGECRNMDDELEDNENIYSNPLAGSSRYNSLRGQGDGWQLPHHGPSYSNHEVSVAAMLQEQQQLLHKVLDTQNKMQQKQEELETKLNELSKRSETSSSSPDSNSRRKCRITRDLTVSNNY